MESIRTEIEAELKRTRLDKCRLYDLLLKIIDNTTAGGVGPQGPAGATGSRGATGPAGPAGPTAPVCECKCVSKVTLTKQVPTKKKLVTASVV